MQTNSSESARSLRNLYFVRTVFQVIWAALFFPRHYAAACRFHLADRVPALGRRLHALRSHGLTSSPETHGLRRSSMHFWVLLLLSGSP